MYCHAYSRQGHIALTLLSCALLASCSPSSDEPETEVQRFGSEEDIKVALYISPLLPSQASESGESARFEVSLNEEPLDDVMIRFTSSDLGEVESGVLIFTGSNWGIPQELELRGVDDTLLDGDQQVPVDIEIITLDERYAALSPDPLTVDNLDNEDPDWVGIGTTSPTTGDQGSGGSGGNGGNGGNGSNGNMTPPAIPGSPSAPHLTFEDGRETLVSFTSHQPHDYPIRISLQVDDDTEGRITTIRNATDSSISNDTETSFTFAPERWPETWDVTLRGIDDNLADGNIPYTITMEATYEDPDIDATIIQQIHMLSIDGVCGNGILESNEECDDGNTIIDACAYGEECCNVCGPSCFEVEGTPGGSCGDGIIQGDEMCDPASPKEMCEESPFAGGVSACEQNCQVLDTSRCFMSAPPRMHIAANHEILCQQYGTERLSCAGRDVTRGRFSPPLEPVIKDVALDGSFGGCLVDQFDDITCWGYPFDPFDYIDEGDVLDIDISNGRLCAVLAAGTVRCWAGGPASTITAQGLSRLAKPLEVVLDNDDPGDFCVRFDDQSMDCGQAHLGNTLASRPFVDASIEIIEMAIDGQWTCALGSNDGLFCTDGIDTLVFTNVRAFHLDQELCIIDQLGALSCPSNPPLLDNFDNLFNIDVREGLEDVVFNDELFCVLREDRTTRCWGRDLNLDQALEPLPWEGEVESFLLSEGDGIVVKRRNTPWRAIGERFLGQFVLGALEQLEALGQQHGLEDIVTQNGITCGLLGNGELVCPNVPLPLSSSKQPYSRLIPAGEGPAYLLAVNAAREIERHRLHEPFPTLLTGFESYFTGVARPIVASNFDGLCVGGENSFTTCITGDTTIDDDPPDFLSDIALTNNRACAIRAGSLVCWGSSPWPTPSLTGYLVQVEASFVETCVRDSAGEVWCWYPNEPPAKALPGSGYSDFALLDDTKCGIAQGELICRGNYMIGGAR